VASCAQLRFPNASHIILLYISNGGARALSSSPSLFHRVAWCAPLPPPQANALC
jgi:hypothetical protein